MRKIIFLILFLALCPGCFFFNPYKDGMNNRFGVGIAGCIPIWSLPDINP